jgi:hypothetical protein
LAQIVRFIAVLPAVSASDSDHVHQRLVEAAEIANHPQADVVAVNALDLALEGLHEQLHQEGHLVLRTTPVLGTEGEQREVIDLVVQAGAHHLAHGIHALGMAGNPGHQALAGPAAVAVHDDRDVPRNLHSLGNSPRGADERQSHHDFSACKEPG